MKKLSLIAICLVGLSSCNKPAKTTVRLSKKIRKYLALIKKTMDAFPLSDKRGVKLNKIVFKYLTKDFA